MSASTKNKVITGEYLDKLVGQIAKIPCIILKITRTISLDNTNVSEMEFIYESSNINVASAATRGFIGEMLFRLIDLAAVGTATRDERYIVGIVFKDGCRSVLEIDGVLYKVLLAAIE